jgi:hypothetical protein
MRVLLVYLLFPVEYPMDEAASEALGHGNNESVLRRVGLKEKGSS